MSISSWRPRALAAVALLSLPPVVALAEDSAREAPTPVELPAVVVPLPPEEGARAPTPDEVAKKDPTGAITVLPARLHDADVRSAAEVLSTAPGVHLSDSGGYGQLKVARVRGAGSNGVLVLLDGVPLNGAGGVVDLSRLPSAAVERYELLRGGAGARYGSGGLGGAINLKTLSASSKTRSVARVQGGSFGTFLGDLSATGPLGGGEALLFVHAGRSSGNYPFLYDPLPNVADNPSERRERLNNAASQVSLLGRFGRALSPTVRAEALVESSFHDRGLAGAVPNTSLDARHAAQRLVASARVTREANGAELSARGYLRREAIQYEPGSGFLFPQTDSSAGLELDGQKLLGRHGVSVHGAFGRDFLEDAAAANPGWWRGAVMAADEVLLFSGQASVVPSLRVDAVGPHIALSPKLGAQLSLPRGFELKANAGQAARVPSFSELYVLQGNVLPNPTLKPERALFADVSVGHRTELTGLSLTAFRSVYEDLISYEYHPPFSAKPYNFATARAEGLEAEGSLSYEGLVDARAAYTLTSTKNLRDRPAYFGRELPFRPRHRLSARVDAGPGRAKAHLSVEHQSEQFHNRSNTTALPSRTFVDAGIRAVVTRAPSVTLGFEVKNVLDVLAQDVDGYPLPGRAAYVTLAVALDSEENVSGSKERVK